MRRPSLSICSQAISICFTSLRCSGVVFFGRLYDLTSSR